MTTVEKCKYEFGWHAIVDPFIERDELMDQETFFVLLRPGLAKGLVHHFEIDSIMLDGIDDSVTHEDNCREDGCW